MFELEHAIANWKRRLAANGACAGDSAAELESHLRDSIATLSAKGLAVEESFLLATRRIGDPDAIQHEYAKEHSVWRDRLLWMLVGILVFQCVLSLAGMIRDVAIFSVVAAGAHGTGTTLVAAAIGVVSYIAAGVGAFLLWKTLPLRVASRPLPWISAAVFVIFLGQALGVVASAMLARFATSHDFGNVALGSAYVSGIKGLLIPFALSIAIARLRPSNASSVASGE